MAQVRYFESIVGGGGVEIEDDGGDVCQVYINNSLDRSSVMRAAASEMRRLADQLDAEAA